MTKVLRRTFLEEMVNSRMESSTTMVEDKLFKKYANKKGVPTIQAKSTAGLSGYTGPWTETEVVHMLRRLTFGVKQQDVTTFSGLSMSDAVDALLNTVPPIPTPPVNDYESMMYTDPTGVFPGQTWVNAPYGDTTVDSYRENSLKKWWMGLMVNSNSSIFEKMVYFWHNHFAIEFDVVGDSRKSYNYYMLLRAHAMGNFKTFVKEMTTEPAMLVYLNGYLNVNYSPDENYARELQELFTVSKDYLPHYTEDDVQAAARVLTGWRINNSTLLSYFDPTLHDTSNKQFSFYYNNAIINGQSGMNGANETNTLVNMMFAKFETAKYICTKLYRFFVYYDIDATVESTIIEPLANILVANNFEIKPVLMALFKSDHFFDVLSQGCFIRTPLDFIVGTFRTFNINIPNTLTYDEKYAVYDSIRNYSSYLNVSIGQPPNVAGWSAFYQTPEYHEIWINSTTLPRRQSFTDMMLNGGFTAGTPAQIKIDHLTYTANFANAGDPDALIDYYVKMLLGLPISVAHHDSLKSILLSGQVSNYYWTNAWDNYVNNPNVPNTNIVSARIRSVLIELTRLAEHHLS
jgi:uncharacterized protein (DUF1800 family)